ncbi:MAG TPA: transketolase C-terminal domain-containing protein [Bacteroidales bacterium]|nr:transketolase family protein [Bacteroidales bacterium]HNQ83109.1 transketolase C-terminal domain-containing protein [Bacteroidales bacterium]HOX78619.1 transketolase C-terminal domain-containing protein [Bacteroidales bacterium]HPI87440.1 transketolase C-terminal domain-containing protein [Bacteroidales bacterium]HPM93629.1 transketolase C-terminal domain-containing protein [Bacteroidales bacterium]
MAIYLNRGNVATKTGFGEGVREAARINPNVVGLGADITASVGMNLFADEFPERFYSLGIAEQNCVGVAAGMALAGKVPVFSTYGVFAALRTTDFIRISLCYNNLHAIIGGAHAGISVGPDGATHQALEDLSVMRSLPNMTVISPCDATQTRILTIKAINEQNGPVYVRFGREPVPDFSNGNGKIEIGKSELLIDGEDATIIATGHLVWAAIQAAAILKESGINVRVLNMHTIKPIDKEAIIEAAVETGRIVTAEEHQVTGGLGSAVAEVIAQRYPVPVRFVGMPDCFGESGKPDELMKKYGMSVEAVCEAIRSLPGIPRG